MTGGSGAGQAKSITLGEVVRAALPFSQETVVPTTLWSIDMHPHTWDRCLPCGSAGLAYEPIVSGSEMNA